MKKKVLLGLFFSTFALAGIAGCNHEPKASASFDKDEYILSLNDNVDFSQNLNVTGVELNDLSFASSNENVLSYVGNGFVANASGQTYVLVKYKDTTLASVKVVVKYKMAKPKNFEVHQENGCLTWDRSYVIINGEKNYADEYEVSYMDITDGGEGKEFFVSVVNDNEFLLEQAGNYLVKVKAKSDSKYIDESDYSDNYYANYNSMGFVENFVVSYKNGYKNDATVSWDEIVNASYDVFIDDIKVISDLEENSFDYDFSSISNSKKVKIEIRVKDKESQKIETSNVFEVNKLASPDVKYAFQNGEGYLFWSEEYNWVTTAISATSENTKLVNNLFETLNGFDSGIHYIGFLNNGGKYEDDFYLSSNLSPLIKIAKLETPEV